jgi:hypothetical protein
MGGFVTAAIAILIGLGQILGADRRARAVERRVAAGDDRYFEEQRSYRSYPSLRDPAALRRSGFVTVGLGLLIGVLSLAERMFAG